MLRKVDFGSYYGELLFKQSGLKIIEQDLESPDADDQFPDSEDQAYLHTRQEKGKLYLKNLQKWVQSNVNPQNINLLFINYSFQTKGNLVIELNYNNGFVAKLFNTSTQKAPNNLSTRAQAIKDRVADVFQEIKDDCAKYGPITLPPQKKFENMASEFLDVNALKNAGPLHLNFSLDDKQRLDLQTITENRSEFSNTLSKFIEIITICESAADYSFRFCRTKKKSILIEFHPQEHLPIKLDTTDCSELAQIDLVSDPSSADKLIRNILNKYQLKERVDLLLGWMKLIHHDQSVCFFNRVLKESGYLLPLQLMALMIKKYRSTRFGTEKEAEEIYNKVAAAYPKPTGPQLEEMGTVASDIMLVHKAWNGKSFNFEKMRSIHQKYPNIKTFNTFVDMCLSQQNLIVGIGESLKGKEDELDDWTCSSFLKYYFIRNDLANVKTHIENTLERLKTKNPDTPFVDYFVKVLRIFRKERGNSKKMQELSLEDLKRDYYDKFPEATRGKERIQREWMVTHINYGKFEEAFNIFLGIQEPKQPTFGIIIELLWNMRKLEIARKLLLEAELKNHLYLGTKPYWRNTQTFTIDFHSFYVRGGGAPDYRSYNENQRAIMLWSLFLELRRKNLSFPLKVEFICGKGTFETRDSVKELLWSQFGWCATFPSYNPGMLECTLFDYRDFEKGNKTLPPTALDTASTSSTSCNSLGFDFNKPNRRQVDLWDENTDMPNHS